MQLTGLIDEDFINYKLPSMFLSTTKCLKNCPGCQNTSLKTTKPITVHKTYLIARYVKNDFTKAIIFGGLDPFDTFDDLYQFSKLFRHLGHNDPIVIYTGYDKKEILADVERLVNLGGIFVIKFGAYVEGDEPHFDIGLGVNLASNNQYSEVYNDD